MTFVVVALYLLLGALEVWPAWRRGRTPEATAAGVITGLGAVYAVGALAGWPLPNPVDWVTIVFRPVAVLFGAL